MVYPNLSKAFDRVPVDTLLQKVIIVGIHSKDSKDSGVDTQFPYRKNR